MNTTPTTPTTPTAPAAPVRVAANYEVTKRLGNWTTARYF